MKSMPCKLNKLLLTAGIDIIRPSHHDKERENNREMMVKGCGHKMSRQLIKSMPCKISKLLLTADIDVIRASHHDIKRYEGEKDSSDDQKRERERARERE